MIDLHCHLLPIDDGASDMTEALQLARIAVANGITHAVLTPHIHPGRYENDVYSIAAALNRFRNELEDAGIPLRVAMGAEVRIDIEILSMIEQGRIPFVGEQGGYRILLLEFPHSHVLPGTDKIVDYLLKRKIRPMIAHPERNKDVLRDLDKIRPFVEAGCLLQVTAGAVAGRFGPGAQQRAAEMLQRGWVEILASDAHDPVHRVPDLEEGRRAAAAIVGEEMANQLVKGRPWAIAQGLFVPEQAGG